MSQHCFFGIRQRGMRAAAAAATAAESARGNMTGAVESPRTPQQSTARFSTHTIKRKPAAAVLSNAKSSTHNTSRCSRKSAAKHTNSTIKPSTYAHETAGDGSLTLVIARELVPRGAALRRGCVVAAGEAAKNAPAPTHRLAVAAHTHNRLAFRPPTETICSKPLLGRMDSSEYPQQQPKKQRWLRGHSEGRGDAKKSTMIPRSPVFFFLAEFCSHIASHLPHSKPMP